MLTKANPGHVLPGLEKDIDQDRIMRWAKLSGDFNRLHVDPEFAKQTRFGGTIAHGPMSLAFLNELMMECFGAGWAIGGKLLDVRFVAPIRPGECVRIEGVVKDVQETEEGQVVECELWIRTKDGEKAVLSRGIGHIPKEPSSGKEPGR